MRPLRAGEDARPLHRDDRGGRAALAQGQRARLDDGGVLDASRLHRRADATRGVSRPPGWADGRDPAPDRPRAPRRGDFEALGERTLWLDCDVLQADGGTRCASITGVWIAARRALDRFGLSKALAGSVAAVSVGIVGGEAVLDLDYEEDSSAETDMNVVMTGEGELVEVQATAERDPFSRELLDELLDLAASGIEVLSAAQLDAVAVARA